MQNPRSGNKSDVENPGDLEGRKEHKITARRRNASVAKRDSRDLKTEE